MNSDTLMKNVVRTLDDKKAKNIVVIRITKLSVLADYFVICSGTSTRHVKSLSDELKEKMSLQGLSHQHIEGYDSADWLLMDYGDVIVHIFKEEAREFYNIERLWSDGEIVIVEQGKECISDERI